MSKASSLDAIIDKIYQSEAVDNHTVILENKILAKFDNIKAKNNGIDISDILSTFSGSKSRSERCKIMGVINEMLNKNVLKQAPKTKRLYLVSEEVEEKNEEKYGKDFDVSRVIEYFESSVAGSVAGIPVSKAIKDITAKHDISKNKVAKIIHTLIKNNVLHKGPAEGTLIFNSVEEEEENVIPIPGVLTNNNLSQDDVKDMPLTNTETDETLKARGFREIAPNIYQSSDGKQHFILTPESTNFDINKVMYNTDDAYTRLCEEFEEAIDDIESFDMDDQTDGLDEFDGDVDTDIDDDMSDEGEEITITLTKDEHALIQSILEKLGGTTTDVEEDIDIDIDDDGMGDEDIDVDVEEDTYDDLEQDEEEIDIDEFDEEEDAEELAGIAGGVHDASFSSGAASMKKHSAGACHGGKPVTTKNITPHGGQAHDAAGSVRAASMKKHSGAADRGGKPVRSKLSTTGKSLFEL